MFKKILKIIEKGQMARVNHELRRMGWRFDKETREWTHDFM